MIVRRQLKPKPEDIQIGPETITIWHDGIERTNKVPRRLVPFLGTLRQLVLEKPADEDLLARSVLVADASGWRVVVSSGLATEEDIVLFGCGTELLKMEMAISKNQSRAVVFGLQ